MPADPGGTRAVLPARMRDRYAVFPGQIFPRREDPGRGRVAETTGRWRIRLSVRAAAGSQPGLSAAGRGALDGRYAGGAGCSCETRQSRMRTDAGRRGTVYPDPSLTVFPVSPRSKTAVTSGGSFSRTCRNAPARRDASRRGRCACPSVGRGFRTHSSPTASRR